MKCAKCGKKWAKASAKDKKEWRRASLIPNQKQFAVCGKHVSTTPLFSMK